MTAKLEKALNRLKNILPLKERQEDCSRQIQELHQRIRMKRVIPISALSGGRQPPTPVVQTACVCR